MAWLGFITMPKVDLCLSTEGSCCPACAHILPKCWGQWLPPSWAQGLPAKVVHGAKAWILLASICPNFWTRLIHTRVLVTARSSPNSDDSQGFSASFLWSVLQNITCNMRMPVQSEQYLKLQFAWFSAFWRSTHANREAEGKAQSHCKNVDDVCLI